MEKLTMLISRFTEDEAIEMIIMLESYKSLIEKSVQDYLTKSVNDESLASKASQSKSKLQERIIKSA